MRRETTIELWSNTCAWRLLPTMNFPTANAVSQCAPSYPFALPAPPHPACPAQVLIGPAQESSDNAFVGGENRWAYSSFVNWEYWWPAFPVLVYFKVGVLWGWRVVLWGWTGAGMRPAGNQGIARRGALQQHPLTASAPRPCEGRRRPRPSLRVRSTSSRSSWMGASCTTSWRSAAAPRRTAAAGAGGGRSSAAVHSSHHNFDIVSFYAFLFQTCICELLPTIPTPSHAGRAACSRHVRAGAPGQPREFA